MKIQRIFSILSVLLVFSQVCFNQAEAKAILVDEMENSFCSEEIRARVDNFLVMIQNNSQSKGYIVGYADSAIPGRFHKYYSGFQKHLRFRKFPIEQVKFLRGTNRDKMIFQFWLVPKGAEPPKPSGEYKEKKIESSTLFDKSHIRRIEKGEVYFGGEDEPCDWGLDLEEFAKSLIADLDLTGYLVVFSDEEKDKKTDIAIESLTPTIELLTSKYNVPKNRLTEIYGGIREEREMELWLIPKGDVLPKIENTIIHPILSNEFGKSCSEEVARDYDGFTAGIQQNPASKGYIIFNGEYSQEGNNIKYIKYLRNYPKFRGFNLDLLTYVRGANQDKMKVSFWIVPPGAEPPEPEKIHEPEKINSTTLFHRTYAEIDKDSDTKKEYFVDGFTEFWGCSFAPNLEDFAEVLISNEKITGYIVIYGSKKKAEKIKKLALKELTNTYKVPKNRLKTKYGRFRESEEIELWLVPENGAIPKIEKSNLK